ncbi:MAG TPA: DUF488 family protein [Tepidisphaeraceae bacterium]|nr:DUF488 family protein [Tepidisphaeraceae bacterium]
MDPSVPEDGHRLWVEPIDLTRDLRQWCKVDYFLVSLAPPRELWDWFEQHPDGYEYFRGKYHELLEGKAPKKLAMQLAKVATQNNLTLLHQSSDPERNTAAALYEFISELQAYCEPDL